MATGGPHDRSPLGTGNNWVTKVGGLPGYIREIAHALIRQGHTESNAIQLAIGTCQRWARGGGDVTPATRAKAAAAIARWEAMKGASRASSGGAKLSATPGGKMTTLDLAPTVAVRRKAAAKGQAMPDLSFPIRNASDLSKAIRLAGNAKDPAKARRFIIARAKALGLSARIPDTWNLSSEQLREAVLDLAKPKSSKPAGPAATTDSSSGAKWKHGWVPANQAAKDQAAAAQAANGGKKFFTGPIYKAPAGGGGGGGGGKGKGGASKAAAKKAAAAKAAKTVQKASARKAAAGAKAQAAAVASAVNRLPADKVAAYKQAHPTPPAGFAWEGNKLVTARRAAADKAVGLSTPVVSVQDGPRVTLPVGMKIGKKERKRERKARRRAAKMAAIANLSTRALAVQGDERSDAMVAVVDLAARWKHGWIPLNAEAVAITKRNSPPRASHGGSSVVQRPVKGGSRRVVTSDGRKVKRAAPKPRAEASAAERNSSSVQSRIRTAHLRKDAGSSSDPLEGPLSHPSFPGASIKKGKGSTYNLHHPDGSMSTSLRRMTSENVVALRAEGARKAAASKPVSAMSNADKITNAEKMFGTGSAQHLEAQRRFGSAAPSVGLRHDATYHPPISKIPADFKTRRDGKNFVLEAGPQGTQLVPHRPAPKVQAGFVTPPSTNRSPIRGGAEARANLNRSREISRIAGEQRAKEARTRTPFAPGTTSDRPQMTKAPGDGAKIVRGDSVKREGAKAHQLAMQQNPLNSSTIRARFRNAVASYDRLQAKRKNPNSVWTGTDAIALAHATQTIKRGGALR